MGISSQVSLRHVLTPALIPDPATVQSCVDLAARWAPTLRALANPEQLLIALWLVETSATVRELEKVTGLSQPLVSYHLRALREAGLVVPTAGSRASVYRLASPDLDKLAALLGTLEGPST